MEVTLHKDKTTRNTVRFTEQTNDHPINIYLTKERVAELGNPEKVLVTIVKEE